MGMGRRESKDGDEFDATSKWGRRYLIYIQRVGVRSSIKRKVRRRERREAKQQIRKDREND